MAPRTTRSDTHARGQSTIPSFSLAIRICACAQLACLIGLVACKRVPPTRERGSGVSVAVIGDFGSNDEREASVAALVRAWDPDLVATVGDNNYPNGSAETIDANIGQYYHEFISPYSGKYGPGARTNRFFPALGNHDWETAKAAAHFAYFELPGNERYYAVRRGALELFILDSEEPEPDGISSDSVQAEWLRTALAGSTARYKLVLLHHPPFSSGPHHSAPTLQWPFREWGATAVLAGHDHDYERIDRAGMPYIVIGAGGKRLYGFKATVGGSQIRVAHRHGALLIEADDERASARFVTAEGEVLDSFALPSAADLPAETSLVPAGARWKYLADGALLGDAWRTPGFDDSSWRVSAAPTETPERSGVASIAFTKPEATPPTSSCFRREFDVAEPAAFGWLELALPTEDEVVAHLNGVEVAHTMRAVNPLESAASSTRSHSLVDPSLLVAGRNLLAIELLHRGGGAAPALLDAELKGFSATSTLLAEGGHWSYLDTGAGPAAGWQKIGFDDSSWSRGEAPLGYGVANVGTHLRRADERGAASLPFWLRGEFSVARSSGFRELLLRVGRSGGGIVYLNRVEIARWNLPDDKVGARAATTRADSGDANAQVEIPVAAHLLVDGSNVIAVELHPGPDAESSLAFDLALLAVR